MKTELEVARDWLKKAPKETREILWKRCKLSLDSPIEDIVLEFREEVIKPYWKERYSKLGNNSQTWSEFVCKHIPNHSGRITDENKFLIYSKEALEQPETITFSFDLPPTLEENYKNEKAMEDNNKQSADKFNEELESELSVIHDSVRSPEFDLGFKTGYIIQSEKLDFASQEKASLIEDVKELRDELALRRKHEQSTDTIFGYETAIDLIDELLSKHQK